MQSAIRLPNIHEIVDPILGEPYARFDCWGLARHILQAGFGLDIIADPERAAEQVTEVWWYGEPTDPLAFLQPWDWLIFMTRPRKLVTDHIGLVLDPTRMVHTRRRTGVCLEPLARWRSRLFQVARLRILL